MEKLLVHLDGASRGNPGEASIGAVLIDPRGNVVEELAQHIGRATNNVAEYRALIEACKVALDYAPDRVIFFTDSQLVANQVNGVARVRQPHLQNLNTIALDLLGRFAAWSVRHVDRTANWHAHRLAERALSNLSGERKRGKDLFYDELKLKLDLLGPQDRKKVLEFANHLLQRGQSG